MPSLSIHHFPYIRSRETAREPLLLGTLPQVAFAVLGVIGEVAGVLPGGVRSWPDYATSAVLLVGGATASMFLPWERIPSWCIAFGPFVNVTSVSFLIASQGSGIDGFQLLMLVPLTWAAFYHPERDSVTVAVAVVAALTTLDAVRGNPIVAVTRTALIWVGASTFVPLVVHSVRRRVTTETQSHRRALHQASMLARVAESLVATLVPDEVIDIATRDVARLVLPMSAERRGQYYRVEDSRAYVYAQFDARGRRIEDSWSLEDKDEMEEVIRTRQPVQSGSLWTPTALAETNSTLETLAEEEPFSYFALAPIAPLGRLHGVLAVARQEEPMAAYFFECFQSIGRIVELALANALAHTERTREAYMDPMTGLANRRALEARARNRPSRRPYTVIVVDIDNLKQVNDFYGHKAGDDLIVAVASSMEHVMRKGDVLARIGGDEFAALLNDSDEGDAERVAERLISSVASVQFSSIAGLEARISAGYAVGMESARLESVLKEADYAMYRSKRAGGMTVSAGGSIRE